MQQYDISTVATDQPARRARRNDTRKRDIVARGAVAGRDNLLSGVEDLQSHGVEAQMIRRVLHELLNRRAAQCQPTE
jgi:hypothetical protein